MIFLVGLTEVLTPKFHSVITGRRDLLYDQNATMTFLVALT